MIYVGICERILLMFSTLRKKYPSTRKNVKSQTLHVVHSVIVK